MESSLCWQCGGEAGGTLICPQCRSLQPPPSDYFRILGLEPRLGLDAGELQKRFYELSRLLHPDRFQRSSERERRYSLEATAVLNDAYRTLREPVARAEYVLKRNGLEIGVERSRNVPAELLEEVFELNMALEELRGGERQARPQLEQARGKFLTLREQADARLGELFGRWDAAPDAAVLEEIRGVLNRRRYIRNLVAEVDKELAA